MGSGIQTHQYRMLFIKERALKLQILKRLQMERSFKKNSFEHKENNQEILRLTLKLDDVLANKESEKGG